MSSIVTELRKVQAGSFRYFYLLLWVCCFSRVLSFLLVSLDLAVSFFQVTSEMALSLAIREFIR